MKWLVLVLFAAVGIGSLHAGLSINGTLLYFTPSYDETYFVINGSGFDGNGNLMPAGKRINNPVGFTPGFRLDGSYWFNRCFHFGFRWTHLFATSEEKVVKLNVIPQLWPTESIPSQLNVPSPFSGEASSRIAVMYQKGEVLFDEWLWSLYGCRFALREAIEWSYIRYHETVKYVATNAAEKLSYHAHTKGIGPQLGVITLWLPSDIYTWFPKSWALRLMTTGSLIVANSKPKITTHDTHNVEHYVTQSSFWRVVPEWNLTFGINYLKRSLCMMIDIELGYEITTYIRGASKLIFDEASVPGHSFNQYSDFYVHGAFLSCTILF